jgi:hypothetical protein
VVRTSTHLNDGLSTAPHLYVLGSLNPRRPHATPLSGTLHVTSGILPTIKSMLRLPFAGSSRRSEGMGRPLVTAGHVTTAVFLYLTGDKSSVVSVRCAGVEKRPLNAVNDGVPRLQGLPMPRPSCAKARNSMRKCSLSTPRHTRKYEALTVRIPVYAAFGHQAGCSGATPRHSTGGRLDGDPHGHCVGATADH